MARVILTPEDGVRIAEAVAAAERGTTGEIRCVLADGRDPARAALVALGLAVILPTLALLFGLRFEDLSHGFGSWSVAHQISADAAARSAVTAFVSVQAVIFALALAVGLSPLPRWLTPATLRQAAVHRAATAQFEALGLAGTEERTGVLLYVSLAHHRAEVLADEGIYAKAPHQAWDEVIALLTAPLARGRAADGFLAAVARIGEILAEHLPPREGDRNELSDAPVIVR